MGPDAYCDDVYRGRRASKDLYLPVLPGAWALGDGLDVHLLEEYCTGRSGQRAVSPPHPGPAARQSGSGSPSVWSSLLESLTGALDLSGGWEYSRSDSNRLAPRGGGGATVSAGGAVAISSSSSSSRGGAGGVDGVVLVTSSRNDPSGRGMTTGPTGSGLLHRSCSTSVVPSVAAAVMGAPDAPALLGRNSTNSSAATAAAAAASARRFSLLPSGPGGCSGSGGRSAATSARTSTCGLASSATSSGPSSAVTTATGMATPAGGRSARSSGSGCAGAGGTFEYLACLPASGCAERDLIDSVLASPLGGGVPAQVSARKQD